MSFNLVEIIVFLPIVAALAILVGSPARITAFIAAGANLVLALFATLQYANVTESSGASYYLISHRVFLTHVTESGPISFLSLSFGLDGISLTLVLLTVLVTLAAVWVSPPESKIRSHQRLYYLSSLLISGGALGAFCSLDLFFFFAFHELALIPTFLMIGIHGHGKQRVRTAWKITIYLGVGSMILLAGLTALVMALGGTTLHFEAMQAYAEGLSPETQRWIFLTLMIGFGILVSLFPFHTWAPAAYAEAPAPTAMLHSGVLKKFGLYGLIRVAMPMLPEGAAYWQDLLLVLLLGNILIIGLVTIAQKRFDTLLGNSSVMHMGYIFLGIASANTIGFEGAVLLMFAHGVSIALLFALCDRLRTQAGTLEMSKLGGLAKSAPAFALLFGMAAFASIGLPGFANFTGEVSVFFGSFLKMLEEPETGIQALQIAAMLAIWGVVISAVYMLRAFRAMFKGPAQEGLALTNPTIFERLPILLLVAALLTVGFYPESLMQFLRPTIETLPAIAKISF